MTSQIPDTFIYDGKKYELVALDGEGLITPQDYGMNPEMLHTACYRGFYSTYKITTDGLFLTKMAIGNVEEGYKAINGIMPTVPAKGSYDDMAYEGLRLLTPFTGRIRIGKDLIEDLYIHMGYQKASSYETLLEFTFEAGKLISVLDRSEENAGNRGAFKKRYEESDFMQKLDESFSFDINIE